MPQSALIPCGFDPMTPKRRTQLALDFCASKQMEAEVRRVLHALVMPEYVEAWLQLPGTDRVECHADRRSFDRFRIDLFSSSSRTGSIFASCLLSKPNKITYLWERDHLGERNRRSGPANSVVEIRLWGHLSRCTLNLKHSGFNTGEERDWHSRMWLQSLENLRALMEGIGLSSLGPAA